MRLGYLGPPGTFSEEAVRSAESRAGRSGTEVALNLAPDLPPLEADANQLRQLFTNLLTNAFEAMEHKGHVTIDAAREAGMLVLRVDDDGEGLPVGWTFGSTGTGLRNLAARLSAEFGPEQSLSLARRDGGGVRAEVRLPYLAG